MIRRRSWLFTPAMRPERFGRAAEAGADVLIMDLEDAVAPGDKDRARSHALAYLAREPDGLPARAVRINPLQTRDGVDDLQALLHGAQPELVVVPKAEAARDLCLLAALLTELGSPALLVGLIETARGLEAAADIACATPRMAALMIGTADLAADLGAVVAWEPLLAARARVVAAAACGGITAIDAPCFVLNEPGALETEVERSTALGFGGKAAIHPRQVAPINAGFTPSPAAIAEARQILAATREGVGMLGGKMIDEAMAKRARRMLAAAGEASEAGL